MIWARREEPAKLLPIGRGVEIVDEFAELNPRGRVFLGGGECLLTPERLFALTRRCSALGLRSYVATNGSLIDEAMAESLILEGADCIALSLNSLHAKVHDYTPRPARLVRGSDQRHPPVAGRPAAARPGYSHPRQCDHLRTELP